MINLIIIFIMNLIYSLILFKILGFSIFLTLVYISVISSFSLLSFIYKKYKLGKEDIEIKYLENHDIFYVDNNLNRNEIYVDINDNIFIGESLLKLDFQSLHSLILHEKSHIINKDIFKIYFINNYMYFEILIVALIMLSSGMKLNLALILLFLLVFKDCIIVMVRNKLKDELEDRADLYVIEKGYKDGLIQALDYYLEIYKPEYDQDINMGYYNLKKRFEDIKSTKA